MVRNRHASAQASAGRAANNAANVAAHLARATDNLAPPRKHPAALANLPVRRGDNVAPAQHHVAPPANSTAPAKSNIVPAGNNIVPVESSTVWDGNNVVPGKSSTVLAESNVALGENSNALGNNHVVFWKNKCAPPADNVCIAAHINNLHRKRAAGGKNGLGLAALKSGSVTGRVVGIQVAWNSARKGTSKALATHTTVSTEMFSLPDSTRLMKTVESSALSASFSWLQPTF